MLLSLSVTTYNRKRLSEFCIRSIHERTFPREEYELVVIDNGSTDGTIEMLQKYKRKGVINKLVLHHTNSLGASINRAWKISNSKAVWLLAISNDHFCMHGWFENFKRVIASEIRPEYLLAVRRMPSYKDFIPAKTKNGGVYLIAKRKWKFGYPFGGGLAIKRQLAFKHKIKYPESLFHYRKGSVTSAVCRRSHDLKLRFAALGKPCVLAQDSGFNDPEYKSYYDKRFGIAKTDSDTARRKRKLALLRRRGYMPDPDSYYEGADYAIGAYSRKALITYVEDQKKIKG